MEKNENRQIALRISGVKKMYKLGQIGGGTLQADLQSWWAKKRGKEDPNTKIGQEQRLVGQTFMALNGVDFTVYQGDRIGIIGGNGAGKSTLLKLISQVTAPTAGQIELFGRVASMLEVGTGFNGEMTGRENVYMNGAILGMTKSEIDAKMEQIIEFSEVRDFIDTPVKRYSSGMYVKLAFSVAAHLDSEIMIMDEVLAVGDVQFQSKCIEKMRNVALNEGKTVLYVSHNMSTVRNLCNRCIVLEQGKIVYDGGVEEAIEIYSKSKNATIKNEYDLSPLARGDKSDNKKCSLEKITFASSNVKMGECLDFHICIRSKEKLDSCLLKCVVHTTGGDLLGIVPSQEFALDIGENKIQFSFNTKELSPGGYVLDIIISERTQHDYYNRDAVYDKVVFEIAESHHYYNTKWQKQYWGNVLFNEIEVVQ